MIFGSLATEPKCGRFGIFLEDEVKSNQQGVFSGFNSILHSSMPLENFLCDIKVEFYVKVYKKEEK